MSRYGELRFRSFERILLIKPSAVGDVIHTLPVLVKLRARYPSARIDWLLTPAIAELVRHHPALSSVLHFDRHEFGRLRQCLSALAGVGRLLRTIRGNGYDLVIDLHGQFRSALFTLASGTATRIGFDRPSRAARSSLDRRLVDEAYRHAWTGAREGSWIAYSHRIAVPRLDQHALDRYLQLGDLLGFDDAPPDATIPIPEQSQRRIRQWLDAQVRPGRPIAVLVPGTAWQTKHWPAARFAEVGRHLLNTGREVVLAGSPAERSLCQDVVAGCRGARDCSGQTSLSELAALLRHAQICVTNDSGAMHLAVALDRPVVSIFGPTDPVWVGPYRRPEAVVRAELACAPCYRRLLRHCPHAHACMEQVTSAQVIDRLERILLADLAAAK